MRGLRERAESPSLPSLQQIRNLLGREPMTSRTQRGPPLGHSTVMMGLENGSVRPGQSHPALGELTGQRPRAAGPLAAAAGAAAGAAVIAAVGAAAAAG